MKKIVPVVILATIGFATSPVAFAGESDPTGNSPVIGRPTVDYKTDCPGVEIVSENLSGARSVELQALANACIEIQAKKDIALKAIEAQKESAFQNRVIAIDRHILADTIATLAINNGQQVTINADGAVAVGPNPATVLAADGQLGVGGYGMMPGVTNWWNGLGYAQAYSTPAPATPGKTKTTEAGKGPSSPIVYPSVGGDP